MEFDLIFEEQECEFELDFGEIVEVSDGGFEKGYQQGYEQGNSDGYQQGYEEGLTHRTYETWVITLADGTIVEKEVGLL